MEYFAFAVDPNLRHWSRAFGVRPENCTVRVSPTELSVTFGRWSFSTSPANVAAVSVTGPYDWWKIAGPPRLSLADRGITFATTAEQGVCLQLRETVGAIDPLHLIRHPNVTLTVAEPRRFAEAVQLAASLDVAPHDGVDTRRERSGNFRESFRALRRWKHRENSVTVIEREVPKIDPPPQQNDGVDEAQGFEDGVGAGFHRRYRLAVDTSKSATEAMAALQADLNLMTREDFAPFERVAGVDGQMRVGDRHVVKLAGPWKGPVEVVDVTPNSFRLATLAGHMEAGIIDFSIEASDEGALELTIESWARSGDAAMDVLYDFAGIAKSLQTEMWVGACEAFAAGVGGSAVGPVEVITERARR